MATPFLVRVRRTSRRPLRLGTTNITNSGDGSVVDFNDPIVKRDLSYYANNFVVLGNAEAGAQSFTETMSPNDAVSELTVATGVLLLTGIELPKGFTINSLTYVSGATAADTPSLERVGVYKSDGTTLTLKQGSTSVTTAIGAGAAFTRTLTSPYTTDAAGIWYLAWLGVATTNPTLVGQKPFNAGVANADATKIYAILAAQADLPASQALSGVTASNLIPYIKIA